METHFDSFEEPNKCFKFKNRLSQKGFPKHILNLKYILKVQYMMNMVNKLLIYQGSPDFIILFYSMRIIFTLFGSLLSGLE